MATNAVGQDSRTVTLSVHTHPAFTELLGDVALNKGERLLLACGVTGIPLPKITWAFNNNIIPGIWQKLRHCLSIISVQSFYSITVFTDFKKYPQGYPSKRCFCNSLFMKLYGTDLQARYFFLLLILFF